MRPQPVSIFADILPPARLLVRRRVLLRRRILRLIQAPAFVIVNKRRVTPSRRPRKPFVCVPLALTFLVWGAGFHSISLNTSSFVDAGISDAKECLSDGINASFSALPPRLLPP